jgi:hypothetical protein
VIPPRLGAGPLRAATALLLSIGLGCASVGPLPAPETGSTAVPPEAALEFHERAEVFYTRLLLRRFDTLETFSDPVLRGNFASIDVFFDYYADLAQAFSAAHFQKSRPQSVEIQEFLFEDADHVRIQVRFVGRDGRPLRPDRTALVRRDRWVRADRTWWLIPGRI